MSELYEKSLLKLELDRVLEQLAERAGSELGKIACRNPESDGIRMPVSPAVLQAMRFICFCGSKKLFAFRLPPDAMHQLGDVTEAYLTTQLERGFSTLDFYKSLLI